MSNAGLPSNIAFYRYILGYPGTNKSMAVDLIKDACLDMENATGIPETSLKACRMMDYFIHQKKCMAERKTDEDIDQLKQRFAEEDQKLEQQSALDGQIEQRKSQKEKKSKISPYEKLLLAPGDRIAWNYLLHHHGGFDTEQLNMAAKELEK
ncbi:unnamed protein product, partial [Didymodactylos carnosus]